MQSFIVTRRKMISHKDIEQINILFIYWTTSSCIAMLHANNLEYIMYLFISKNWNFYHLFYNIFPYIFIKAQIKRILSTY